VLTSLDSCVQMFMTLFIFSPTRFKVKWIKYEILDK
jgi:hypothetical protein